MTTSAHSEEPKEISLPPRRLALWMTGFFFFAYLLTLKGYPLFVDEEIMYETAINIVENGNAGTVYHPWTTKPGRDGLIFSNFGIGQSLFEIPFYLVGKLFVSQDHPEKKELFQIAVYPAAALIAALMAITMVFCASALKFSLRRSWRAALILGFCTMIWPYSKMLFRDPLQTWLLFGSVTFLIIHVNLKGHKKYLKSQLVNHALVFSGLMFGYAVTVKETTILFAPFMLLYILWGKKGTFIRPLAAFSIPVTAGVIVCLAYNYYRFNNFLDFGYTDRTFELGMSTPLPEGLFGLLFSSGRSFFLFNPVSILLIPSFLIFFRRFRREALLFLSIMVTNVLFHAKYWTWGGSWAWGPRFLLIIIPYTIIPIASVIDHWKTVKWKKYAVCGLIAVSIMVQIPGLTMHIAPYLSLIAHDVKLFPLTYENDSTIRSDLIHVDFIPQFSPIWGLTWALKHALTLPIMDRAQIRDRMKKDCPWGTISSEWVPEYPDKALGIGPDFLGVFWMHKRPDSFGILLLLYFLDGAICLFCLFRVRRLISLTAEQVAGS